jgi:hypothetical protein
MAESALHSELPYGFRLARVRMHHGQVRGYVVRVKLSALHTARMRRYNGQVGMIYVLTFGRAGSRILGVFTSKEEAENAKDRVAYLQRHPRSLLFIEQFEPNRLTVESEMSA